LREMRPRRRTMNRRRRRLPLITWHLYWTRAVALDEGDDPTVRHRQAVFLRVPEFPPPRRRPDVGGLRDLFVTRLERLYGALEAGRTNGVEGTASP